MKLTRNTFNRGVLTTSKKSAMPGNGKFDDPIAVMKAETDHHSNAQFVTHVEGGNNRPISNSERGGSTGFFTDPTETTSCTMTESNRSSHTCSKVGDRLSLPTKNGKGGNRKDSPHNEIVELQEGPQALQERKSHGTLLDETEVTPTTIDLMETSSISSTQVSGSFSNTSQSHPTTSTCTTLRNSNVTMANASIQRVGGSRDSAHDSASHSSSITSMPGTMMSSINRSSTGFTAPHSPKTLAQSIANENALERMGLIRKATSIRTTNMTMDRNIMATEEFTINKLQFGAVGQLFGRDKEIALLQQVYQLTAAGGEENETPKGPTDKKPVRNNFSSIAGSTKQAVFIGGAPGSGKSILAMDTTKRLCRRSGGFFLSGKFSSGNSYGATTPDQATTMTAEAEQLQTQPYSGVGDACTTLVEDILMVYFNNDDEDDSMSQSDELYDFVGESDALYRSSIGARRSSAIMKHPSGIGRSSQQVPYNYHRWKITPWQMKHVWADERQNLEILTPIVNNIDRLWGGGIAGAMDAEEDDHNNKMKPRKSVAAFAGSKQAIHYAFARFFAILSDMAPLVVLLDDLQWADSASLDLFESLLVDEGLKRLLFIGTIRNDAETNIQCPATNMEAIVKKFTKHQRRINAPNSVGFGLHRIEVEPLTVTDVALWMQALLDIPTDKVMDLAECIHKRTAGNALYAKEFLLSLNHLGLLKYHFGLMKWQYDIEQILTETVAAQNVVTILTKRMESLPPADRAILPKIASIGSAFTYHMFQVVVEDMLRKEREEKGGDMASSMFDLGNEFSKARAILDNLEVEGILIMDPKHGFVKWAHDKIREAALNLIGDREGGIAQLQFEIGKLLFSQPKQNEIDSSSELYVITNLLNSGATEMASGALRNDIIRLNCRSGETALMSSAYGSAARYFSKGIELLPADDQKWDEEFYQMTLELYSGSAVSHFCVGQHETVQDVYDQVMLGIRPETPIIELRRVYDAHVDSLSAQGRTAEALEEVVRILKVLGCRYPKWFRTFRCIVALIGIVASIDKRTKKIAELPPCEDKNVEWIMYLLNRMSTFCYQIDQAILPLVYEKGLNYTLKNGVADFSSPNLAVVGLLLAAVMGNFVGGKKYSDLALKCVSRNTEASTIFITKTFVYHFLEPFESCKKPLLKAYEAGLRSGDLESGFWAIYAFLEFQFFTAARLSELLRDLDTYCWQMRVHQQEKILRFTRFTFQVVSNLANRGSQRHVLTGKIMDETKLESRIKGNSDCIQDWVHFNRNRVYAAFWFGEHERVTDIIESEQYHKFSIEKFNPGVGGTFPLYAQCALSSISMYRKSGAKKHKARAMIFFKRIKEWVRKGNRNVHHSEALIKAELCTITKRRGKLGHSDPMPHYEVAILLAGRWGLTSDQALAHERLADYAVSIGDMNDAKYHYNRAFELYADWGAHGKIEQLRESLGALPELAPVNSAVLGGSYEINSSDYSFFSGESSSKGS